MQEIYKFLIENWHIVVSVLVFIGSLVVAIVRKRPISDITSKLYNLCICAIKLAEDTEYKGDKKLGFAVGLVLHALQSDYPNLKVSNYEELIKSLIESILSTPQKKGE